MSTYATSMSSVTGGSTSSILSQSLQIIETNEDIIAAIGNNELAYIPHLIII